MAVAKMSVPELEEFLHREFPQAFGAGSALKIERADGESCLVRERFGDSGGGPVGPHCRIDGGRSPERCRRDRRRRASGAYADDLRPARDQGLPDHRRDPRVRRLDGRQIRLV